MSSRTSPALLPDPKRPRLLAPDDETSSTFAVPPVAPNGFDRANYTGRNPPPTQAASVYERGEWQSSALEEADDDECSRLQPRFRPLRQQRVAWRSPRQRQAQLLLRGSRILRRQRPAPSRLGRAGRASLLPPRKKGARFPSSKRSHRHRHRRSAGADASGDPVQDSCPGVAARRRSVDPRSLTEIGQLAHIRCYNQIDLANGPQKRPPYTPEDYERLLQMHRRGESVERIALVLHRTRSSIINHFRKHKPIWTAAGE